MILCCGGWSVDAFNEGRWRCRHDQCCLTHLSVLDSWQTASDSSLSLQSAGGVESWQEAAMITSSMASFQNPKLIICSLYPPVINHGLLENPPFKSMIVPIKLSFMRDFTASIQLAMFDDTEGYHDISTISCPTKVHPHG